MSQVHWLGATQARTLRICSTRWLTLQMQDSKQSMCFWTICKARRRQCVRSVYTLAGVVWVVVEPGARLAACQRTLGWPSRSCDSQILSTTPQHLSCQRFGLKFMPYRR